MTCGGKTSVVTSCCRICVYPGRWCEGKGAVNCWYIAYVVPEACRLVICVLPVWPPVSIVTMLRPAIHEAEDTGPSSMVANSWLGEVSPRSEYAVLCIMSIRTSPCSSIVSSPRLFFQTNRGTIHWTYLALRSSRSDKNQNRMLW